MTNDQASLVALGARLRQARELRRMSQGELAEATGAARQSVVVWERGQSEPGLLKAYKAAEFLGVSLEWLVTGQGEGPDSANRASLRAMIRSMEKRLAEMDARR